MSSSNILSQNASNDSITLTTRRDFLGQIALLATLPVLPALPEVITQEAPTTPATAEAVLARLTDLSLNLAVFIAKTRSRMAGETQHQVSALELIQEWNKASQAANEIDELLISIPFDEAIQKPLCGGAKGLALALAEFEKVMA